jgi:hypothetical protein
MIQKFEEGKYYRFIGKNDIRCNWGYEEKEKVFDFQPRKVILAEKIYGYDQCIKFEGFNNTCHYCLKDFEEVSITNELIFKKGDRVEFNIDSSGNGRIVTGEIFSFDGEVGTIKRDDNVTGVGDLIPGYGRGWRFGKRSDGTYTYKVKLIPQILNQYEEVNNITSNKIMEGENMNINEIKKENLDEAQKQFNIEKKNAEIEYAKQQLRIATDRVDELDRQIKNIEEQKKPYLEILEKFKSSK